MSELKFNGSAQLRKRNSAYDIAIESGAVSPSTTPEQYELYTHGITVAQATLYKRASSTPNTYEADGGVNATYTFASGTITFAGDPEPSTSAGWHKEPYHDSNHPDYDLYAIYASANSKAATDVILPNEWSAPVVLSEAGTPGANGKNVCIVYLYQSNGSSTTPPTVPTSGSVTFDFSDGSVSGAGSWLRNPPSADYVWVTTAIASSVNNSTTITSNWSTPTLWKEKGTQGNPGVNGVTLTSTKYGKSSSSTVAPQTWYDAVSDLNLTKGDWLWVQYNYSNSTTSYTKSYIGTDGDDGISVTVKSATKVGKTTTVILEDSQGTETTMTIVDGDDGDAGVDGLNGYIHYAWANDDHGTDFSTSVSEGKSWMGVYEDQGSTRPADSQDWEDYSWTEIKGADGADGQDGADGADAISYWLEKSTTIISKDTNNSNTLTPNSVTVTAKKNVGGTTSDFSTGTIKLYADGTEITPSTTGTRTFAPSASVSNYVAKLFDGATELDAESIPIIPTGKNGTNGTNGSSAVVAVLTNDSAQVPADKDGNVSSFLTATTTIEVYEGGTKVTPTSYGTHVATNCTIDDDDSDSVTLTAMSADSATVVLKATYKNVVYQKIFTITKQKQGNTGSPGVSVTGYTDEYAAGSSDTTAPSTGWGDIATATAALSTSKRFLWNRETVSYSSGSTTQLSAHVIYRMSTDGQNAKNITGVLEEYAYGTSSAPDDTTWATTAKTPSQSNPYVWQRERVIFDTTPTTYGSYSTAHIISVWVKGDDALVFKFKKDYNNYVRDLRSSANNTISLNADIQGYGDTAYWAVDNGTLSASTGNSVTLTIPKINNYDTVTITLKNDSSSPTRTYVETISVVDKTEYGHYYGLQSSAPTSSSTPKLIYVSGKAKDYFTASKSYTTVADRGKTLEWNGTTWQQVTDASKLLTSLKMLIDDSTDLSSISDANSVSFFNIILAQQAIIESLFSNQITILSGGHIKGGERYNASGSLSDYSENGFWFGADGTLKANLQSDGTNTIVGTDVLTESQVSGSVSVRNTAIGYNALNQGFRTTDNVAVGYRALFNNGGGLSSSESGGNNVAVGNYSLYNLDGYQSHGIGNTAVGYYSQYPNSSGNYNTSIGYQSLYNVTSGSYNVGINGNAYSPTGSYQINISDRFISLDFRKGRQYRQIFTVLKSFFKSGTYEEISCLGSFEGERAYAIRYYSDGSDCITIQTADGVYTLKSNTSISTVLTCKATLCFIKPCQKDTSTSINDCLS